MGSEVYNAAFWLNFDAVKTTLPVWVALKCIPEDDGLGIKRAGANRLIETIRKALFCVSIYLENNARKLYFPKK